MNKQNFFDWDYKNPHVLEFQVLKENIDVLGHVNNKVYLEWCELVSWDHSKSLGVTPKIYKELRCACVVVKNKIEYLGSLFEDDSIVISTWITDTDSKLKLSRLFQESFNLRAQTDKDFTFNDALSFAKFYLDQVDMDSSQMISKYPHELSGGECQRAMIAFVLSKKPSFIIADESTTGLDVSRQKKVINFNNIKKD